MQMTRGPAALFNLLLFVAHGISADNLDIVHEDCECKDFYGSCRTVNEVWISDSTWQHRCNGPGDVEFLGCVSSVRSGGQLIPAGSTGEIVGFWHKCETTPRTIRYEQERFCEVSGQDLHVEDTFRDRVFQKSCQHWGIGVDGCFYPLEDGKEGFLQIGESADVGLVEHHCTVLRSHPNRIQYWTRVKKGPHIKRPAGKGHNQNLPPQDILNFLPEPPRVWLQTRVREYIRNDGLFQAKIRYLD